MAKSSTKFDPVPSIGSVADVSITVARSGGRRATVVGVPVGATGQVPAVIGVGRAALASAGFEAKVGQTFVLPRSKGPSVIAIGIGRAADLDANLLRDAAAAFARAASKHARLAVDLIDAGDLFPADAAAAIVEGILLARYRFGALKTGTPATALTELTLIARADESDAVTAGAVRGRVTAAAGALARDLANTPPGHLTATRMAEVATAVAKARGLKIEVFDEAQLAELGCGGMLGVNAGSSEPPRMIRLTYRPKRRDRKDADAVRRLTLVGKGIMYDSGGISLKPSDAMHAAMKMDMSGAAAVLAAMSALGHLGCSTEVTGYLMCTDNMPSGSATNLGDVLTIRGGKTIEVVNTDAEGRLVLADGLVLATEAEDAPDAIVDIATLTGAAMRALGESVAVVIGNDQALVDQVSAAGTATDERVWQLPLETRYRKKLDSEIADMKNIGGENAGAITAALFLAEFVGTTPWAHIDIAGTMRVDADDSWRSLGATGFGARLLIDLAMGFTATRA